MSPFFPLWSELSNLFQIHNSMFLSQICVAAGVKNFDPNILHPNNLYLHLVYLSRIQCTGLYDLVEQRNTHISHE